MTWEVRKILNFALIFHLTALHEYAASEANERNYSSAATSEIINDSFLKRIPDIETNKTEVKAPVNSIHDGVQADFPATGISVVLPVKKKIAEDETDVLESLLVSFKENSDLFPLSTEMASDNVLLQESLRTQNADYPDSGLIDTDDVGGDNLAFRRRDISDSWQFPISISDANSFPWNSDSGYYPHESRYVGNDYLDYSSIPVDVDRRKNSSSFKVNPNNEDSYHRMDHYPKRNYYFSNEYDSPRRNKYSQGNRGRGRVLGNPRKHISKDACKQYLEFLKYAFEKLDESQHYDDDYAEDYRDNYHDGAENKRLPPSFFNYPYGRRMNSDSSLIGSTKATANDNLQTSNGSTPSTPMATSAKPLEIATGSPGPSTATTTTTSPLTYDVTRPNNKIWNGATDSLASGITVKNSDFNAYSIPAVTVRSDAPPMISPQRTITEKSERGFSETYRITKEERHRTEFQNFERTASSSDEEMRTPSSPLRFPSTAFTATPSWMLPENYFRSFGEKQNRTIVPEVRTSEVFQSVWETPSQVDQDVPVFSVTSGTPTSEVPEANLTSENNKEDCNDKILPCPDMLNITYPLNGYCDRYVTCESGRAIRRTCPHGLHFNIITKSCDLPHNSFCNYACSEPDGYFGIPGDCSGYFVCKSSSAEYRMCPPKMHWDAKHDVCTFIDSSTCPMKCSRKDEVAHYDGDCTAYIVCLNGVPYYHKCPPNMKFDPVSSVCVPERLSRCVDDPKLMTRIYNPSHLCRDVNDKFGTENWCRQYKSKEKRSLENFEARKFSSN